MMQPRCLPSWLSLLYIPADQPERLSEALEFGAHAIILDLEDFVPQVAKAKARCNIEAAASLIKRSGLDVVVRINQRMDLAVADLDRAVIESVDAIMVTKVMGAQHLRLLDETVGALERQRGLSIGKIKFIALIETVAALSRMHEIDGTLDRMIAIGLGGEDIARECNMQASAETLQYPKQKMIFHSQSAGLIPLGYLASVIDYKSEAQFTEMLTRSRQFGFQAATCLKREQVAMVNKIYAPSQAERDNAKTVIEAYEPLNQEAFPILRSSEEMLQVSRAKLVLARAARSFY
jgi:citrate lyase subunit beta/citryl-CoA lyase